MITIADLNDLRVIIHNREGDEVSKTFNSKDEAWAHIAGHCKAVNSHGAIVKELSTGQLYWFVVNDHIWTKHRIVGGLHNMEA